MVTGDTGQAGDESWTAMEVSGKPNIMIHNVWCFLRRIIDEAFRDVIAVRVVPIEHGSSRALQPLPGAPVTPCLQLRIEGVT